VKWPKFLMDLWLAGEAGWGDAGFPSCAAEPIPRHLNAIRAYGNSILLLFLP